MSNLPSARSISFYDTFARDQVTTYAGNATDEPYGRTNPIIKNCGDIKIKLQYFLTLPCPGQYFFVFGEPSTVPCILYKLIVYAFTSGELLLSSTVAINVQYLMYLMNLCFVGLNLIVTLNAGS